MYIHILNLEGFEYRNYMNGYREFMRTENIVSISEAKRVVKKRRRSYGFTRDRAERISLNTQNAYLAKYPSTSEA